MNMFELQTTFAKCWLEAAQVGTRALIDSYTAMGQQLAQTVSATTGTTTQRELFSVPTAPMTPWFTAPWFKPMAPTAMTAFWSWPFQAQRSAWPMPFPFASSIPAWQMPMFPMQPLASPFMPNPFMPNPALMLPWMMAATALMPRALSAWQQPMSLGEQMASSFRTASGHAAAAIAPFSPARQAANPLWGWPLRSHSLH